jgi:2-polyprenyl-3-methyl-5-hydroxy-6-metoxy-1,4-benzoquinol methylase
MTSRKYADIDKIYRTTPLAKIPWNSVIPPEELVSLVRDRKVRPCPTIDLGCGTGNYAMYLAQLRFDVTGVDSSPTAIRIAKIQAKRRGMQCRFVVADLLGDMHEVTGPFSFAYDWEVLHHIYPEDRGTYMSNVAHLVERGGLYFSASFAESDPQFGGTGKYRTTPIGTKLYFSSEDEIRTLVSPYFTIRELTTVEIEAKVGSHHAVCLLAERK